MNKQYTATGKQTETMEQCNSLIISNTFYKTLENYQKLSTHIQIHYF
jgi:hypothetical protein